MTQRWDPNADQWIIVYPPNEATKGELNMEGTKKELNEDGAVRYDVNKPDISLIPPECIIELAQVFTAGAQKYAPHNWKKGMDWSRVYNSAMRHLLAFWGGENNDKEDGLSHLSHALWNVTCLLWYTRHFKKGDNRKEVK